jgi:hypothetical protein
MYGESLTQDRADSDRPCRRDTVLLAIIKGAGIVAEI